MTTTYDAWLADPTRERIVLAEVQPAEALGAFAAASLAILPSRLSTSGLVAASFGAAVSAGIGLTAGSKTNFCLVVRVAANATNVTGVTVTLAGTNYALTKAGGAASGTTRAEIWYLLAPVDSGTTLINVAGTAGTTVSFVAEYWYNVSQTSPWGTAATATVATTTPSVTVTASATMEVLDVVHSSNASAGVVGAGQSQDANGATGGPTWVLASHEDGAASTAMSWSGVTGGGGGTLAHVGIGLQGAAKYYTVSWAKYAQTTVVKGGLYRRLDSVRQNTTALTSRATTTLLVQNPGSYLYDSTTDTIAVVTSTGASPNTFDLIGAWFTIFLSTDEPEFTDGSPLYEPRLTGRLPQFKGEKPDELFGATIWGEGELEVANGDALFDVLSRTWMWENKLVTIKVGGPGLALTDYLTVGVMRVQSINVDDVTATLAVQRMADILTRSVPVNSVAAATEVLGYFGFLISANSEILSLPAPFLYGNVSDVPMRLAYDDGSQFAYYIIRDASDDVTLGNPLFSIDSLYAINRTTGERTSLTVGFSDLNQITTDGTYAISSLGFNNYQYRESEGYDLRCDVSMLFGDPLPGTLARIILLLCGESAANIDTAAFTAADVAAPYTIGLCLTAFTPASEVLRTIEQTALMQVYVGADGRWTCRVFDPAASTVAALVAQDFGSWDARVDDQSVLSEVRVRYAMNPSNGGFSEASRSDTATAAGRETTDFHSIATYLRDEADAQEVCDRYAFIKQRAHGIIESDLRGLSLINAQPGDLVSLTRDRAASRSGAYDSTPALIREIVVTLGPSIGVVVTVDDLGEVLQLVGVYSDDTGADWASATAAQKATLAFYSDDNGFIDAADAATRHRKVYW